MDLVDSRAAAVGLGVAPATLRSWVARGKLKPYGRERRRLMFAVADVLELAQRESEQAPQGPVRGRETEWGGHWDEA